jgi:hypothetical protein
MRVFIGPTEIAGLAVGWAKGLRAIGVDADLVCIEPHPFEYSNEPLPGSALSLWSRVVRWRSALKERQYFPRVIGFALQPVVRWWAFVWSLSRYDAFVFIAGRTITDTSLELTLLRLARRRVVVVFVGSDARPPYIDGSRFPLDLPFEPVAAARQAKAQRRKIARLERGAHACINAPATAHFHKHPFVNWFALGIPKDAAPAVTSPPGSPLQVLHSPSHPTLKGTATICAVVDRLKARGLPISMTVIERQPNNEVIQAILACDLLVDQLYSDTPMAGFAAEGASQGRAVLVAGYRSSGITNDLRDLPVPPTLFVSPEDFESTLERLVCNPALLKHLGSHAHAFMKEQWSPVAVAQRLLRIIRGDIPADWWFDPAKVDYVYGCGLSEVAARDHVRSLIEICGVSALQVDDKPELRKAFIRLSELGASAP